MKGEQFLYVGSTSNLAKRPIRRDKGHENRFAAIMQATHTQFYPCESKAKAYQLEERLIREHKPIFNMRCPRAEPDLARTWQIIKDNW